MQDHKSLRAAVTICGTLVDIQTQTQRDRVWPAYTCNYEKPSQLS